MSKKNQPNKDSLIARAYMLSVPQMMVWAVVFASIGGAVVWKGWAAPHNGGKNSGTSTLTGPVMVIDKNGDGGPNWGDTITFNVSTTATSTPEVRTDCYQGANYVFNGYNTFFAAGINGPNEELSSGYWTSGAADCTAKLFTYDKRGNQIVLATLNFHVNA